MHRSIPILITTAAAIIPVGHTQAATRPKPTPTPVAHARSVAPRVAARAVVGPSVDMRWGPVQVTIIVTGKRITDGRASTPAERARSAYINYQAVPLLRQEVLQAQSASIDLISGATMTSEAYAQSLQAALAKARI